MKHASYLMAMILVAIVCALAVAPAWADGYAEDAVAEIPVPPVFKLPPAVTPELIVVANDDAVRQGLSDRGYWVVPSIARAVLAAEWGYTIYVTAGTYYENVRLEYMGDLQIIGEQGVLVIADNDQDVFFLQECEDIRIHNIDMVHEIGESPCLHNCIVIWDCQDVLVEYCDLSGCGYIGVEVLGNGNPDNIRVENCAIHDCEVAYYDVADNALRPLNNVIWACAEKEWE
ncbi:right-handed parallel beta-helix repeat-containing protein [bacterium]|nr:right-handed parallel beta-helix repeat-containing protein [bacterium]